MPAPLDRDILRMTLILEIAERVQRRHRGLTRDVFINDRDEIDMTAYRLGSIGEYVGKLADELTGRHPEIDWRRIRDMRNILFHDYDGAAPSVLWLVAGAPLSELITVCAAELAARTATPGSPDASP